MKSVLTILLSIVWVAPFSQENETYVTIDTKGHMGLVKNVAFSPDGSLLYSASDDKTIRVWDVASGLLLKTYRGYIEDNHIGMINSGALSPNGDIFLAGGFLGSNERTGDIRIHNAHTGELIGLLEGNDEPVVALQFSPEGYLAFSGTNNGTVGIWNVNSKQGVRLDGHSDGVYGICVAPKSGWFMSCGYDQKLVLWNYTKIAEKGELEYVEMERKHTGQIRNCAWSPSGKYIVTVGFDNKIILWNSKGKFIEEVDHIVDPNLGETYNMGDINCVAFSASGDRIVVGTSLSNGHNAIIYSIPDGNRLREFDVHTNAVISCAWFGENTIATAGGNDREILIWDASTGEIKNTLKGEGKRMWRVAAGEGYAIGFGQTTKRIPAVNDFGELESAFNLSNLDLINRPDFSAYTSEVISNDSISISVNEDNPYQIDISNGSTINVSGDTDGNIRCISLAPDGNVVVGCSYRTTMYNLKGKQIKEYKGHSAEVYSMAFSHDGRFMYTASGDQTIKIWNLADEGKLRMTFEEYMDYVEREFGKEAIDKVGMEALTDLYNENMNYIEVKAIATLYVANDKEWICWTNENYYATSRKGSRSVGFHVNQGHDVSAKYYEFEQFDVKFNRPDIVLSTLKTDTADLGDLFKNAYFKRLQKLGISQEMLSDKIQAPKLELNTNNQKTSSPFVRINFVMSENEDYLNRLFITNNDIPTLGRDGLDFLKMDSMRFISYSMKEYLVPGMNRIQMWCTNTKGVRSKRETVNIIYAPEVEIKPDLYFIGIGASEYQNADMNLKYAAKDVDDFISFYTTDNALYDSIHVKKLQNNEITLGKIEETAKLVQQSKITDHVIIYIAGHGVLDANFDYFLATYNMDFKNPETGGFAYSYLEKLIDKIPARTKTIFMDACHSGELDKEEVVFVDQEMADVGGIQFRSVGTAVKSTSGAGYANSFHLMKNIFTDLRSQSGATVIASAGGAEYALEGDQWKNGVFTYALIDGLKSGAADLNDDGKIMLSETQKYLQQKVSQLTDGRQKPISRYENNSNDFVFWKLN